MDAAEEQQVLAGLRLKAGNCLYGVFDVKPFSGGGLDDKLCALRCLGMLAVRFTIAGMALASVM